ncbi:MAG: ABC transporter ATP-binding protein, partial [Clostridia bacterium]|nr:ABC transporter ATP-binding protein [Clostridia bacterium]
MLKKLMGSIRQFKAASILSPVCVTLEVALECIIPLYMVEMLEKIQIDNSIKTILLYGGVLLALAAFSLLFGVLAGKFAATASTGFARNLRKDMYYSI